MQIRFASPHDLEFIEGAYAHARAFMQANGNATQWPEGYPGRIDAEEDIARGHCFLVSDDEGPLAVFSFAPGPDETYAKIDGAWHSDADYHVIHRVAAVRGHGVARAIFRFATEHADYLRCDTHEDNAPMRRALESFGFRECGTITVANGTQRIAYDWTKETLHGGTTASPPQHARLSPLNTYPTLSHAIPRRHRLTTPQKPHDSNGSVSKSEILVVELHATLSVLHPIGSIAPDQSGCIVTDEVHDPIGNKLFRGRVPLAVRKP